jgi:adenylate cyclase
MVDYSRLMASDETGTLARLKAMRREIIEPMLSKAGGEIVKLTGDGMLVLFGSVVAAAKAAADIQSAIAASEADSPTKTRISFRIGLHLGDVMLDDGDIYGDDVNIAARLESEAKPGGIALSAAAYQQIRNKTALDFVDAGEVRFKNVPDPVRLYRAVDVDAKPAGGGGAPERPVRASIAVLPFANMSVDPEQEYFSDGIAEDIITELARSRSLTAIARNSSFRFRGQALDMRAVGRELGVDFLLEGSVGKSGQRIRVTAQLIEAGSDSHVWAERYDGTLEDIFHLQDEITRSIVTTTLGRLTEVQTDRLRDSSTTSLTAYDHVLRGLKHMQGHSPEDYARAERCFGAAVEADPDYARAHAELSLSIFHQWVGLNDPALLQAASVAAERALALDPNEPRCHLALGMMHIFFNADHDKAQHHLDRAAELNPNDDLILVERGRLAMYSAAPIDGTGVVRLAMRRNPFHPNWYWNILGRCYHTAQMHAEALEAFGHIDRPLPFNRAYMAACHAALGQTDAAQRQVAFVLEDKPDFTVSAFARQLSYRDEAVLREFVDSLLAAGLPP